MGLRFWPNRNDPDHEDQTEGVDEMSMEDLLMWLNMAATCSIDPDLPAQFRAKCDYAIRILAAEIEARQAECQAPDAGRAP